MWPSHIFRYWLAVSHAINCIMLPIQLLKFLVSGNTGKESGGNKKKDPNAKINKSIVMTAITQFTMKYILNPVLIGFILYGCEILGGDGYGVRVCISFSLINTSFMFLSTIGSLPLIGSYTNLISKVFYLLNIHRKFTPIQSKEQRNS